MLSTYQLVKTKKFNSVILNYDANSEDFFKWYQQLVSESLGKNSKGILPIISTMPKDNHSMLQLYLGGFKSNFYTFYIVEEENSSKLKSNLLLKDFDTQAATRIYIGSGHTLQLMLFDGRSRKEILKAQEALLRAVLLVR